MSSQPSASLPSKEDESLRQNLNKGIYSPTVKRVSCLNLSSAVSIFKREWGIILPTLFNLLGLWPPAYYWLDRHLPVPKFLARINPDPIFAISLGLMACVSILYTVWAWSIRSQSHTANADTRSMQRVARFILYCRYVEKRLPMNIFGAARRVLVTPNPVSTAWAVVTTVSILGMTLSTCTLRYIASRLPFQPPNHKRETLQFLKTYTSDIEDISYQLSLSVAETNIIHAERSLYMVELEMLQRKSQMGTPEGQSTLEKAKATLGEQESVIKRIRNSLNQYAALEARRKGLGIKVFNSTEMKSEKFQEECSLVLQSRENILSTTLVFRE